MATQVYYRESTGQYDYLLAGSDGHGYIFTIDKSTGALFYANILNVDFFPLLSEALDYLACLCCDDSLHETKPIGIALLGATIQNNNLVICVVKSASVTAKVFNCPIYTITRTDFLTIPIQNSKEHQPITINSFPTDSNHFYCNDLNIGKHFPYEMNQLPESNFCWNSRWREPFSHLGVPQVCIILYQGAALSLSHSSSGQLQPSNVTRNGLEITYILKRASSNPGTRYISRGINSESNPANECSCDLIFSFCGQTACTTWERGSVPVLWKTTLSSSISTPIHEVCQDADSLIEPYFLNLYNSTNVNNIKIISLLHEDPKKGETELLQTYRQAIEKCQRDFLKFTIEFNNFDLNVFLKQNSAFQVFQDTFGESILGSGFTVVDGASIDSPIIESQKILFRFNCADSLDRTNLATFYYAYLKTSQIICRITNLQNKLFMNINKTSDEYTRFLFSFDFPNFLLRNDIIAFLGNSFISAGNIVSLLYTNTPAIKTGSILSMMPEDAFREATPSDTYISIQRRYCNVFTDPERQNIINEWLGIDQPRSLFSRKLWLPYQYISISSLSKGIIPYELFLSERPFLFDSTVSNNFAILLPVPARLKGIKLTLLPISENVIKEEHMNFTLGIGNDTNSQDNFFLDLNLPNVSHPAEVYYDLMKISKESCQYPLDLQSLSLTQFIFFKFSSLEHPFPISSIKLQIESIGTAIPRIKQFPLQVEKINEYTEQMKNFGNYSINNIAPNLPIINLEFFSQFFSQAILYEEFRIKNGISIDIRNSLLCQMGQNPAFYDPAALLIIYSGREDQNIRCICNELLKPDNLNKVYIQDSFCPSLICTKINNFSHINHFFLCNSCAAKFDLLSNNFKKAISSIPSTKQVFIEPKPLSTPDQKIISKISRILNSLDSNDDFNDLLSGNADHFWTSLKIQDIYSFKLVFKSFVRPTSLTICLKNQINISLNDKPIRFYTNSISTGELKELAANVIIRQFIIEASFPDFIENEDYGGQEPIQTMSIEIVGGNKRLTIRELFIEGTVKKPELQYLLAPIKKELLKTVKLPQFKLTKTQWNEFQRTQTITPDSGKKVIGIVFKINQSPNEGKSLIFNIKESNKPHAIQQKIIIPFTSENYLYYYFGVEYYTIQFMQLFYLDRIPNIEPYKISLLYS